MRSNINIKMTDLPSGGREPHWMGMPDVLLEVQDSAKCQPFPVLPAQVDPPLFGSPRLVCWTARHPRN